MPVAEDRAWRGLDVLRILMGIIWAANLLFILLPAAGYWGTFADVAAGYGPSSLIGPGFPDYVAANPVVFSWLIAVATGYLAFAFLVGCTTRLACVVGFVASVAFLVTQWNTTFAFPGGTDVGAHPLYLAVYVALFVGGAGRFWSLDSWIWRSGKARLTWLSKWIATPAPLP
ncbi:MAG TPA: hypothetical protein VFG07_00385 [Thermoplasmata archaeon]|nr:hypothetical protein [Thermoplasmata archaeon]